MLLDDAKYPHLDYGRAGHLAKQFGVSKSGARKWIREDQPPRPQTLQTIIETIYKKTKSNTLRNTSKVIAWLQYGDAINGGGTDELLMQADHLLLGHIYLEVHKQARRLGIDLESLPKKVLDHVYNTVITQTLKQDLSKPDKALIVSLLEIVKSK